MLQLESTWQEARGIGQGLENQGATCYINSIVQCLVHNPIIANLAFGTLRHTCKCVRCALCYLAFRTRCSLDANHVSPERKASYPRWMISAGLPTLGTQSNERLSACKQVHTSPYCKYTCQAVPENWRQSAFIVWLPPSAALDNSLKQFLRRVPLSSSQHTCIACFTLTTVT